MITIKDEINLKKSIYGLHHNIGDLNWNNNMLQNCEWQPINNKMLNDID
jgi:hypothetical protein